jgi:hypothetical protein
VAFWVCHGLEKLKNIIPARDPKQCGGSKKIMYYIMLMMMLILVMMLMVMRC